MSIETSKSPADALLDGFKVAMTAGGLMMLWNIAGTLSSMETTISAIVQEVDRNDGRITYLERGTSWKK